MIWNWWIWHREWEEDEDVENMSAWEISVKSDNVVTEQRKEKRKTSIERNKKKSLLLNFLARKVKTCCHYVRIIVWMKMMLWLSKKSALYTQMIWTMEDS